MVYSLNLITRIAFLIVTCLASQAAYALKMDLPLKTVPQSPQLIKSDQLIKDAKNKIQNKDVLNALQDLKEAEKLSPEKPEIYSTEAVCYKALSKNKEALDAYTKALEFKGNDFNLLFNRGNLFRQVGEFEAAIRDYLKSSELAPKESQALTNCGICSLALGRPNEAIGYFDLALMRSANDTLALYNRACAKQISNDLQGALEDLNSVLDSSPAFKPAKHKKQQIQAELAK